MADIDKELDIVEESSRLYSAVLLENMSDNDFMGELLSTVQRSNIALLSHIKEAGPDDMEYRKLEKCTVCVGYQYSCSCETAFNLANRKWFEVIDNIAKEIRGEES